MGRSKRRRWGGVVVAQHASRGGPIAGEPSHVRGQAPLTDKLASLYPSAVGRFLERNRAEIVQRWLERLRAQLAGEQALTETELLDSLHLYLDEIVDALRGAEGGAELTLGKSAIARMHGSQRHALQRTVEDLVREYGLLFEAVVERPWRGTRR